MASNSNSTTGTDDTPADEPTDDEEHGRVVTPEIAPLQPTRDYSPSYDAVPALRDLSLAYLVHQYPLVMHVLHAAVNETGALTHSTVYASLETDAVAQNAVQEAFWALERLDVLATDEHHHYLTRSASEIYMAIRSIATPPLPSLETDSAALDLRELTFPRLLLLEYLVRNHRQDGVSLSHLINTGGIPAEHAIPALRWLLENDLVIAHANETYTANETNSNVKQFGRIRHALPAYGSAIPSQYTAVTHAYWNENT